jgi:hypothetical protein
MIPRGGRALAALVLCAACTPAPGPADLGRAGGTVTVSIRTEPAGAEVRCHGELLGSTPLEVSIDRSEAQLRAEFSLKGHRSRSDVLDLASSPPGSRLEWQIQLEPDAPSDEPPGPGPPLVAPPVDRPPARTEPPARAPSRPATGPSGARPAQRVALPGPSSGAPPGALIDRRPAPVARPTPALAPAHEPPAAAPVQPRTAAPSLRLPVIGEDDLEESPPPTRGSAQDLPELPVID